MAIAEVSLMRAVVLVSDQVGLHLLFCSLWYAVLST